MSPLLLDDEFAVISSYPVLSVYAAPIPITQPGIATPKIMMLGQVMCYDPVTATAVPSYPSFAAYTSSYQEASPLGVLYKTVSFGTEENPIDRAVAVILDGIVDPALCIDDGLPGVLSATKAALADRITFVHER